MLTKISSATTLGIVTYPVDVEVDLSYGMLQFHIVGLPDIAIKESKQRIVAALKNSGFRIPERKITVNLAPADLKKEGTLFDLSIALGILQGSGLMSLSSQFLSETLFLGELSLDGSLQRVKGVFPIAYDCSQFLKKKRLIIPQQNSQEAAYVHAIEVIGVTTLVELVSYLRGEISIQPTPPRFFYENQKTVSPSTLDFKDVQGQQQAKRALQLAAAGRHNIMFIGSPGSGKTMLAQRLPSIMPPMSFQEMLEVSKIYSVSGRLLSQELATERPFRAPHHTISEPGLVGGGSIPQPGEITFAHHGVIFLDELTEFKRAVLEVLRQPLESHTVTIARAQCTIEFPAQFLLVAALNPCPCGFFGDAQKNCICSMQQVQKYLEKISGPFLDRIDIQISIQSIRYDELKIKSEQPLSSEELYRQVMVAVDRQQRRFGTDRICWNAYMNSQEVLQYCLMTEEAELLVRQAFDRLHLSMRGYYKLLKVARTIADIENMDMIQKQHIQEAILYRSFDRILEKNL